MFVRDVMTPRVDCVDPGTCIAETARMMRHELGIKEARHVRRLLVLDHDERMVGVLALGDVPLSAAHAPSNAMVVEAFDEYYQWSG